MNENPSSSTRKIAVLIAVLVGLFLVLTCFYQLRLTEAAVLTTFEKPVATVTEPGLHWKWPWPVQKVYPFDLRMRTYQSGYMEYLVKDGFNIVVRAFVCWSVGDVATYKNKVGVTVESGESLVATLVKKHLKSVLAENSLSDLVGVSASGVDRFTAVEDRLLEAMAGEAAPNYGIDVRLVGFDRFELPEDTTAAVFERMRSERMKTVEKIISEGTYRKATIRNEADVASSKIIKEAQAEAIRLRGKADTEAFKHLAVYRADPEFALFLTKLRTLENTMKSKTTIVVDDRSPPFDLLSSDVKLPSAKAPEAEDE